jgi:S-adenosylmethionine/arginine decarboxylase-like enzyme
MNYPHHGTAQGRYGWSLALDLEDCRPHHINRPDHIRRWIAQLVEKIGMNPYGEPTIWHFGYNDPKTWGYTAVQLIETSSITAHFSPHLRTAHIDVFSCRAFDPETVITHSLDAFGGKVAHATLLPRG